jgi:branched-subunit amino acid aminotransferase/4-amino-4-deoxychorismate lyase
MLAISIDGEVVDRERATISVLDRGLLYGDGVFEVFRSDDVQAHLDRLYASAAVLELRVMPREALASAIATTIAAAGQGEHRVRVIVTRGPGALSARVGELGPGRTIVIVEPLPVLPRELSAVTIDRRWIGAGHKTLADLDHIIARELAAAAGADEAIRIDRDGNVAEGATSNLFAVIDGAVVTAPLTGGVLPGITRGHVLAICARLAIPARELAISRESFAAADELFATSALRGVVPITRLDGAVRAAGPVTARIAAAYVELFHRR